ncbi:hypothetical protein E4T56_gene10144 [Termitomyces sp. T112]|nr:hypothetical protein E4T56_gene10144 [Termitomyces sp. T112]
MFGQAFSDQANFAHIAHQSRLPGILSDILKLPSTAWDVSAGTKAFSVFANTIVAIDNNYQPQKQTKTRKVKAYPSATSHKPSSNSALALLSQVNAMLEAMLLANDPNLVPCANLKKHKEAVELVAQQQLFFLDIALQTFKLILFWLDCLNKALGPSEVDHTGALLGKLNVTVKSIADNLDIKLINFSETSAKIPVELSMVPLV